MHACTLLCRPPLAVPTPLSGSHPASPPAQAKRRVYTLQRASKEAARSKRKRPADDAGSAGSAPKEAVEAVPVLEEMPKWQEVHKILQVRCPYFLPL